MKLLPEDTKTAMNRSLSSIPMSSVPAFSVIHASPRCCSELVFH